MQEVLKMIKLTRFRWALLGVLIVSVLILGSYSLYSYSLKEEPKKETPKQTEPKKETPRKDEAPAPEKKSELGDVPPAPNSTETSSSISRDQEGTRFGTSAYETDKGAAEVIAWYEQQLPPQGWSLVNTSQVKDTIVSVYQKGADRLIIKATRNEEQGKTSVTLSFNPR